MTNSAGRRGVGPDRKPTDFIAGFFEWIPACAGLGLFLVAHEELQALTVKACGADSGGCVAPLLGLIIDGEAAER